MAGPSYHGRTHLPGGTDPIPGLTIGSGAFTTYRDQIRAVPTLWSYWPLDDASGDAVDLVGTRDLPPVPGSGSITYGEPGVFVESPAETSVSFTGGAYFGGAFTAPETAEIFGGTQPFTLTCFAYQAVRARGYICEFTQASANGNVSIQTSIPGPPYQSFWERGPVDSLTTTDDSSLATWHHFAIGYDNAIDGMNVYVDGIELNDSVSGSMASLAGFFAIGSNTDTSNVIRPWTGRVAHVALFTSHIGASEIAALAAGTSVSGPAAAGDVWTATADPAEPAWAAPTIEVTY